MTKYIAVIDYKSNATIDFGHTVLSAQTIPEAMNEAEKLLGDNVYLVDIAEKSGRTTRHTGGYKETPFSCILRNRGSGWHSCDESHGELPEVWTMTTYSSGDTSFELKSFGV